MNAAAFSTRRALVAVVPTCDGCPRVATDVCFDGDRARGVA